MTIKKSLVLQRTLLSFLMLMACVPGRAGTIAGNGGATEVTQIANNIQLVLSYIKQAAMVEQQIQTNITTVQQLITMITNLKNLPQGLMSAAKAPYLQQLATLSRTLTAVSNLTQSANTASQMYTTRLSEMNSMNLAPSAYLSMESQLATQKGGIYAQQMNQDLASIDQLQQRSQQLQNLATENPEVVGNLQGMQLLIQQSNMMTGELMDIKAAILQQNVIANQERTQKSYDNAVVSTAAQTNATAATEATTRNTGFTGNALFKSSWESN